MPVIFSLFVVACFTVSAFAADGPPPEFLAEHPEVVSWILGVAIVSALGILGYYVKTSDDNNQKQWNKLDNHETRLSHLEGEHKSYHGGGRRLYDPDERTD